jgi:quinoprotein glucose dehydrogenase
MIGRAGIAAAAGIALTLASADAQQTTQGPSQTPQPAAQPLDFQGWSTFNGDLAAEKYSTDGQITPGNVADLKEAWEFHTGDVSLGGNGKPPET